MQHAARSQHQATTSIRLQVRVVRERLGQPLLQVMRRVGTAVQLLLQLCCVLHMRRCDALAGRQELLPLAGKRLLQLLRMLGAQQLQLLLMLLLQLLLLL